MPEYTEEEIRKSWTCSDCDEYLLDDNGVTKIEIRVLKDIVLCPKCYAERKK